MLVLWVTIAFSGKINTTQLIQLAASDYSVRIGYLIIFAIPAAFIVKFFKSFDQVDIYDVSTNFNPFNLSLENEIKHSHEKQATKK